MSEGMLLLAGLFLPLFPLSMVFNELFDRLRAPSLRIILLVIWPQIGIVIATSSGVEIPGWLITWAVLTSLLYGFRALILRQVSLWISFIATSAWAILWAIMAGDISTTDLTYFALGFSIPLALLVLISSELESRFGAAYTGLYNGIAETLPRLSGVLTMVVLAVIATPLFPAFATMISAIMNTAVNSLGLAILICLVWLTWGWAGARLIQGLIIGETKESTVTDISSAKAWGYTLLLGVLVIGGIIMIGGLS